MQLFSSFAASSSSPSPLVGNITKEAQNYQVAKLELPAEEAKIYCTLILISCAPVDDITSSSKASDTPEHNTSPTSQAVEGIIDIRKNPFTLQSIDFI
jgi:hypothetical protein